MRNLRNPYQMYVLNLDGARIFWLTIILLLLVGMSFFAGLFIGQEKAKGEVDDITHKNKVMMDEIIDKLDSKIKDDDEYQFYELISPKKVNDRSEVEKSVPDIDSHTSSKPANSPAKDYDIVLNSQTGEPGRSKNSLKESVPVLKTDSKKLTLKNPYAVQVASYKKQKNAENLKDYLIAEQYPAYVIKSVVNGIGYFRVRVGPFASRTLSLKVIEMIRHKKGCRDSFIVSAN